MKTKRTIMTGLFLSLLGASLPLATVAAQTSVPRDRVEPKLVPVPNDDYGPRYDRNIVRVWNQGGTGTSVRPGDTMEISFNTRLDAYVVVIDIDTRGRASLLFPTDRRDDGYVEAGRTVTLPGRHAGYRLQVTGPAGVERIVAYASDEPLVDQWQDLLDQDLSYLGWSKPQAGTTWSARLSVETGDVRGMVAAGSTAPRVERGDLRPDLVRVPVESHFLDRDETWFRVLRGYHRGW
jgi:uncharacterized protein DUF4384